MFRYHYINIKNKVEFKLLSMPYELRLLRCLMNWRKNEIQDRAINNVRFKNQD